MEVDEPPSRPPLPSSSSSSQPRPKGILKHSSDPAQPAPKSLNWNEENLTINELAKDSTMKITEPKTPYVRYNAETDEVLDMDKIPGFELGTTQLPSSPTLGTYDDNMPSSPSASSNQASSRRGSEASEKMVKMDAPTPSSGESDDDEMQDEETKAHRKKFAEMRGGHYKCNEAENLKRAQALIDEEESSGADSESKEVPPLPNLNKVNLNGA